MADSPKRGRTLLGGLLALTVLPLLGAWWLKASIDDGEPWGTTNQGQLLTSDLMLSEVGLEALSSEAPTWRLIVVPGTSGCLEDCQAALPTLRALHLRLGKDSRRVTRTFVWDESSEPDATHLPSQSLAAPVTLESGVYIADPLGNLVLRYEWDQVGTPLFEDMKHLLELSRIG